jgi:hypothetical protein
MLSGRSAGSHDGWPMETQLLASNRGVDVAVASPGRGKSLKIAGIRTVILDEADETHPRPGARCAWIAWWRSATNRPGAGPRGR